MGNSCKRREGGAPIPNVKAPCELKFENVSFRYEDSEHTTLNHINLTIHKGEKLAVVGNNGAGKTTLIKLACGLLEPTSGRILFNGIDIREFNRDDYYKLISASFQNVCLLPMSIAMNIGCNNESSIDNEASHYKKINEAITLSGLKEKITSLPNGVATELVPSVVEGGINLSGGEAQKLMLARAIFKETPLIIFDEPTAALDPVAEAEIYTKFNQIVGDKAAVFISHRLSSCRFCERIFVFDRGKIVQNGTHDKLLQNSNGKYFELWNAQARYYQ